MMMVVRAIVPVSGRLGVSGAVLWLLGTDPLEYYAYVAHRG